MGAILLNVCVGAMFYDPISKHMKKVLVLREKVVDNSGCVTPPNQTNANTRRESSSRAPATQTYATRQVGTLER
jgi:hypothetical protein